MDTNELNIDKKNQKTKKPKDKKKIASITLFIVGILIFVGGLVFLLISIFAEPKVRDAEYLVSVGEWTAEPGVIWNFTEIGKGTLTTNDHINDYDFIWAMEDGELKIETDWLYKLENEYEYQLDQSNNILTLISDEESWTFTPAISESE